MKIAIIGAGFFGTTAALKLSKYHDVDEGTSRELLKSTKAIEHYFGKQFS